MSSCSCVARYVWNIKQPGCSWRKNMLQLIIEISQTDCSVCLINITIILMSDSNLLAHLFQNQIKEQKQINGETNTQRHPLKSGEIRRGFLSSGLGRRQSSGLCDGNFVTRLNCAGGRRRIPRSREADVFPEAWLKRWARHKALRSWAAPSLSAFLL